MLIFFLFFFLRQICRDFVLHASDICLQIRTQKQQCAHKQLNICSSVLPASAEKLCQKEISLPPISKQTHFTHAHVAERCSGPSCNIKPLKPNQQNCFNTVGVCGWYWAAAAAHSSTKNGGTPSDSEQTTQSPECKHNCKPTVSRSGFFALLSVWRAFVTENHARAQTSPAILNWQMPLESVRRAYLSPSWHTAVLILFTRSSLLISSFIVLL